MYGKIFESCYSGSMVGSGTNVFALWGYVIAHAKPGGTVEINVKLVSYILGAKDPSEIQSALDFLCSPDPDSRSKECEGRRLIKIGEFLYRIPTWDNYQKIRSHGERTEYMKAKMREHRAKKKTGPSIDDLNQQFQNTKPGKTLCEVFAAEGAQPLQPSLLEVPPETPAPKAKKKQSIHPNADAVLLHLCEKSGRAFRATESNMEFISARLREDGVDLTGVLNMIDRQCKLWLGTQMQEYLRPETLFNKTKFDSYYAAKDQEIKNDHNTTTSPQRIDRSLGTTNEGLASEYEGLGRMVQAGPP